ncbi:hypothetical protein [Dysgonomonas sp. ZJ279]|nr:hypothetical protein [Dysgonomonas sp. ZJ279]
MQLLKYFLIAIGAISIALFIVLLVIGVKVVSTIFLYIIGACAIIAAIGFIIFYAGKFSAQNSKD